MSPRSGVSIPRRAVRRRRARTRRLAPKKRSWTTVAAKTFSPPGAATGATRSGRTSRRTRVPAGAMRRRHERPSGVSTRVGPAPRRRRAGSRGRRRRRRTRRPGGRRSPAAWRDLHQPAVLQHDDAVGERQRLVLVVRDQQRRDVLLPSGCGGSRRASSTRVAASSADSGSSSSSARGPNTSARGERDALLLPAGQLRPAAARRSRRGRPGPASRARAARARPAAPRARAGDKRRSPRRSCAGTTRRTGTRCRIRARAPAARVTSLPPAGRGRSPAGGTRR